MELVPNAAMYLFVRLCWLLGISWSPEVRKRCIWPVFEWEKLEQCWKMSETWHMIWQCRISTCRKTRARDDDEVNFMVNTSAAMQTPSVGRFNGKGGSPYVERNIWFRMNNESPVYISLGLNPGKQNVATCMGSEGTQTVLKGGQGKGLREFRPCIHGWVRYKSANLEDHCLCEGGVQVRRIWK